MIKDLETLSILISELRTKNSKLKIIWDPILKASAGFEIHKEFEKEKLISILKNIFLITPNIDEIRILSGENDEMQAAKDLSRYCNLFLKGGHSKEKQGKDYLINAFPIYPPSSINHAMPR